MVAELECVYKGIKEVPNGSFTNENGEIVNYDKFYKIRFDQIINGLYKETEIKISKDLALNVAKNYKVYDKIIIVFNIVIYNTNKIVLRINNIKKI